MIYSEDFKQRIFAKTDGKCRYCHKQLAYINHGKHGLRGCWQIDHSLAQANGGPDDFENLWAACNDCNNKKSDKSARGFRSKMKPMRIKRRDEAIVNDLGKASPYLGSLLFFVAMDIYSWWKRRNEKVPPNNNELNKNDSEKISIDVPWFGLGCVLVILIVVFVVVKSHKA